MDSMSPLTQAACMAQVLSSPTRLKLIKLVEVEELCVCELAEVLGISQPAVSQHLSKLRQAGLVSERRAGQMALYSAAAMDVLVQAAIGPALAADIRDLPEMAGQLERLAVVRLRRLEGAPPLTDINYREES